MGDFTSRILKGGSGDSFTARVLGGGRGTSSRKSLPELQQRVAELERTADAFGAPGIAQDKPGIFTRLIDILSRPNYAAAGLTEELLNGKSVTSGLARAAQEILSGIGGIEGQKRAFGQVLEGQGFGTKTLAEVFPALDGTWIGSMGSRGAAGLALDIATDPLTYVTFGAGSAARITAKGGRTAFLTKEGVESLGKIRAGFADEITGAIGKRSNLNTAAFKRQMREIEDKVTDKFFSKLDEGAIVGNVIEPGGIRFAGTHIPGTEAIRPAIRSGVLKLPGGVRALEGAAVLGRGMQLGINRIFHPFNELGNLAKELKPRAIALKRDFLESKSVQAGRLHNLLRAGWNSADGTELIAPNFMKRARKELTADEKFGEKIADVIEGTGSVKMADLTPAQQQIARELTTFNDALGSTLVDAGILTKEDFLQGKYLYHVYQNADDLGRYHAHLNSQFSGNEITASFQKERPYRTFREAREESTRLHENSLRAADAGKTTKVYPKLVPEYDFLKNLDTYVDRYSDSLARKAWREQAVAEFGKVIDPEDLTVLYDLSRPLDNLAADDAKHLGKLFKKGAKDFDRPTFELLSNQGKREFIRQALLRSKSSEEFAALVKGLSREQDVGVAFHTRFFPPQRAINFGDAEGSLAKLYPESHNYRVYDNAFTDAPVMLPKIIGDDLQAINTKLINTKDNAAFKTMLRGYDRANNLFKLGVYTLWPASLVRDAYSNIALSMLDIGMGAFNPRSHLDTIGIMGGRKGVMRTSGGVNYRWEDLREMAKDFGVWVPGEVFAELTGDPKVAGTVLRSLTNKRGLIENEARVQLWVQNIRRGLDPRTAADHVGEFLFNYGEVSQVERELFRRLIPFYTFTRKNIQLQVKALQTKPGLVINQVKPFRKRDDESEMMVKWEAESLGIRLNRDGKTVHMIQGIDLPIRNLDTLYAGGVGATGRRVLGMISPLLKVPLEVVAQRDFFTGGDLKRTRGDTVGRIIEGTGTPQPIKDWIGYKKEYDAAGRPKYTFDGTRYALLIRSWAFSRLFSTSDRQFREYLGDRKAVESLMDVLTGLRMKPLDLDDQARRKLGNRVRQLEDAHVRRGTLEQTRPITFERKRRGRAVELR